MISYFNIPPSRIPSNNINFLNELSFYIPNEIIVLVFDVVKVFGKGFGLDTVVDVKKKKKKK
jgi:hypothetical protein